MKRTLIFALAALLVVGAVAMWRFVPRALSYDECSPVYRHFADMQLEGVRVVYVKDKIVNDTLRMPATLLQAETDRGWQLLDSVFGYSKEIQAILDNPEVPDNVKQTIVESDTGFHFYRAHPETPERNIEPNGGRPDDVSVYLYPLFRRVIIFEPATKEEERDVIQTSMKENKEEVLRRRRHALIDAAYDNLDTIPGISQHN